MNLFQIAYTNTFDWDCKIFTSNPDDPSNFVKEFVESILECQQKISQKTRKETQLYFDELELRIKYEQINGRQYWVDRYQSLLRELTKYVDSVVTLGWNSAKYDIPVLRSMGLFYYLDALDPPVRSLKKTGSKYIRVDSKHTVWLDFILFQGQKVPLREYLKQFQFLSDKDDMVKQYFPYRYYNNNNN